MSFNAPKRAAPSAAAVLLLLLTPLRSTAMALPSFRREHRPAGDGSGRERKSKTHVYSSIGLTIDDVEASGPWKMRPSRESKYDGRGRRGFFKLNFRGQKKTEGKKSTPFGRVPRGGVLSSVAIASDAAASAAMERPRQPLTRVRSGVRGVRRGIVRTALKMNQVLPVAVRSLFQPKSTPIMGASFESSATAAATVTAEALSSRGGSSVGAAVADESAVKSNTSTLSSSSSSSASMIEMEAYVIETPLFPIILPKAFEPPTSAVAAPTSSSGAASVASLEISVALEEVVSAADVAEAKPSAQLLHAAAMPLLPKTLMESFTGREFYYPESIEALATTGMQMTLGQGRNEWVNWSGEKKTDAFLRAHGIDGKAASTQEWYQALDASQEVLVWAGKSASRDGYGAELPIIKTTSIIRKSPKYLAELLMDSSKVTVYNKMSLGRTDEKVFQTGVDTQGGSFGDGESKVVRNLTKPPMVNSIIEFVTCMHARKLRPSDVGILHSNDGDAAPATADGYVVVSRAVTGGEWSAPGGRSEGGGKLVRNEILMGVNVLRAVPGAPDRTELTSVTHVHSPMIPLMLAKNAGVKGAVDFVRDIRALP